MAVKDVIGTVVKTCRGSEDQKVVSFNILILEVVVMQKNALSYRKYSHLEATGH